MSELKSIIEALMFASPEPVTLKALAKLLDPEPKDEILAAIEVLKQDYAQPRGLQHGNADQADEQAFEDRRRREILEPRNREAGVERYRQHGDSEHLGRARPAERRDRGAYRDDRSEAEGEPVGPGRHDAVATRKESAHAGQRDDRPLQGEEHSQGTEQGMLVAQRMQNQRSGKGDVRGDGEPATADGAPAREAAA